MANLKFVVRAMTGGNLETAFRVHVSPDAMKELSLATDDLIEISGEGGSSTGIAVAWRAQDGMGNKPKVQPAKMSEWLRETFGFKVGNQVSIAKSSKKRAKASKIVLTDVTPPDYDGTDDGEWRIRTTCTLCKSPAFICFLYPLTMPR